MKKYLQLFPDPADPAGPPPAPAPTPAPPISGKTVIEAKVSEREADLQAEIDVLKTQRDNFSGRNKKLETDIAHLQNELAALKTPPAPAPTPAPAPAPEPEEDHWTKTFLG